VAVGYFSLPIRPPVGTKFYDLSPQRQQPIS
jgi:hypothetical protein